MSAIRKVFLGVLLLLVLSTSAYAYARFRHTGWWTCLATTTDSHVKPQRYECYFDQGKQKIYIKMITRESIWLDVCRVDVETDGRIYYICDMSSEGATLILPIRRIQR